MGLDESLSKRLKQLENQNQILRKEVAALKSSQNQSSGNPARRGLNSLLKLTTLGKIANRSLYMPSSKISPAPPRMRRGR